MPSPSLRVGLGLLSVYPSSNAGTTTYVRGLLSGLSEDETVEVIALANPALGSACGDLADRHTLVRGSKRFATAEQRFGRVTALGMTAALPVVTAGGLQQVDVVHYPQTVRSPRVDRPVVVTLHDVLHLDLPHLFSTSVRIWRRLMYDASARRADAVITNSEHSRARIINRLGIDPGRIHVSYQGVDTMQFTPEPASNDAEVRRSLDINGPYFYYPASLAPHKNHGALLRALRLLEGRRLLLTGPHANRLDELLAEADACGVSDRIQHLGMVAAEALPALYRGASCLVFPSLYEGFGVPIVEAMASGCPVACSDRGASAEIAGSAALVFDPEQPEAIASAVRELDAPAVRERCVAAGLGRAAQFNWTSVANRHRQVYELAAR
jgi:glycosyltransferase involved in cell wall biosynthesis